MSTESFTFCRAIFFVHTQLLCYTCAVMASNHFSCYPVKCGPGESTFWSPALTHALGPTLSTGQPCSLDSRWVDSTVALCTVLVTLSSPLRLSPAISPSTTVTICWFHSPVLYSSNLDDPSTCSVQDFDRHHNVITSSHAWAHQLMTC